MALNLSHAGKSASPNLTKLDPKVYAEKARTLQEAKARKSALDSESRALESTIKALTAEFIAAMGTAPAALCGSAVITRKETKDAAASLTLINGSKVPWSNVTSLLIGNSTVPRDDVQSLYGGRSGSVSIEIAGTP